MISHNNTYMNDKIKRIKTFDKTKLLLFNQFAKQMLKKKKIKWIVVGGLDNFPNKIGRDLDIILKDKKYIKIVQNIFINCLKRLKIKNIILRNGKFYGDVLIAFDKHFNYYELDIKFYIMRSGIFSISPNWYGTLNKVGNFYIEPACFAFKNYFSARKINKIILNDYRKIKKPYWLKLYLDYKIKNKNLNFVSFSIVSIIYMITNPLTSFINLFKGINNKILTSKYNHAPIYFIKNKKEETYVLKYVKKYLRIYFWGIKCIDKNFFLRNIYFRFYKVNNESWLSKFIFSFCFFFRSLSKKHKTEKFYFFYTLKKVKNFKTYDIGTTNKNQILSDIVGGIKQIDN